MEVTQMTYQELFGHAKKWAMEKMGYNAVRAGEYAKWYAEHYPEGGKAHPEAHDYWRYALRG
jgi:hypothetical protein